RVGLRDRGGCQTIASQFPTRMSVQPGTTRKLSARTHKALRAKVRAEVASSSSGVKTGEPARAGYDPRSAESALAQPTLLPVNVQFLELRPGDSEMSRTAPAK